MSIAKPIQWWDYNRTHPIAEGLVALYAMDELMGPTAFDKIQGLDGTLVNGVMRVAEGLSFTGASDTHVDCGQAGDFSATDPFSVMMRVKPASVSSAWTLCGKHDVAGNAKGWTLRNGDSGDRSEVQFIRWDQLHTGGRDQIRGGSGSFVAGQWTHIVCTCDGTDANGMDIYINGRNVSAAVIWNNLSGTMRTAETFQIGGAEGVWDFDGLIDVTSLWSRVLNASEAEELAAKPYLLLQPPSTKAYFFFQVPVPAVGPSVGILHRGQLPGILARAG